MNATPVARSITESRNHIVAYWPQFVTVSGGAYEISAELTLHRWPVPSRNHGITYSVLATVCHSVWRVLRDIGGMNATPVARSITESRNHTLAYRPQFVTVSGGAYEISAELTLHRWPVPSRNHGITESHSSVSATVCHSVWWLVREIGGINATPVARSITESRNHTVAYRPQFVTVSGGFYEISAELTLHRWPVPSQNHGIT